MSKQRAGAGRRLLIAFDGMKWYIRRIRVIEHDLIRNEKIYRCDRPIGNDFDSLQEAVEAVERLPQKKGGAR